MVDFTSPQYQETVLVIFCLPGMKAACLFGSHSASSQEHSDIVYCSRPSVWALWARGVSCSFNSSLGARGLGAICHVGFGARRKDPEREIPVPGPSLQASNNLNAGKAPLEQLERVDSIVCSFYPELGGILSSSDLGFRTVILHRIYGRTPTVLNGSVARGMIIGFNS